MVLVFFQHLNASEFEFNFGTHNKINRHKLCLDGVIIISFSTDFFCTETDHLQTKYCNPADRYCVETFFARNRIIYGRHAGRPTSDHCTQMSRLNPDRHRIISSKC